MVSQLEILKKNKIFCIGLPKTGTTSIHYALNILGFSSIHNPFVLEQIKEYDAASDILIANNFSELDLQYPNAKFILTERKDEDWLKSCSKHYPKMDDLMKGYPKEITDIMLKNRKKAYGVTQYDAEKFIQAYQNHNATVKEYFANKEKKLLQINIAAGDDWGKLCDFLGLDIPNVPFPHKNQASKQVY